jgi:hypothetical protein
LVSEPGFFLQAGKNGTVAFEKHDPIELQRLVTEKGTLLGIR